MEFMYKIESLTLDLFQKASIFGPNILSYINNNQYNSLYLINTFQSLINNICDESNEILEEIDIEFDGKSESTINRNGGVSGLKMALK